MRAMKGLLLGSAAGLFAVASAQAADLPVKAKPVEYVKVCSLYGAGFFYVPGTDTCLKIGMYLRADHHFGQANQGAYATAGGNGAATRQSNNWYNYRARINLTTDWRTQTDYGVLRAYAAIVAQQSQGDLTTALAGQAGGVGFPTAGSLGGAGILRAFIQFAGFTAGHAVSYFDFFNGADYGYLPSVWGPGTGVNGTDLIAYTWQLGNGWSASIDVEDGGIGGAASGNGRGKFILNANRGYTNIQGLSTVAPAGVLGLGSALYDNGGAIPDLAGSIRVDQAWGSAQLMGALHELNAGYYNSLGTNTNANGGASAVFGHPSNKTGYAFGGGFRLLNFLMPKDRFEFQAQYAVGANGFGATTLYQNMARYGTGNQAAIGWGVDSVFTNQGQQELTTTYGFNAAYEHYWNTQWRTAVVGGGSWYKYNGNATAALCGPAGTGNGAIATSGIVFAAGTCNPNFGQYSVSTRTAWNPHPTLEIGLDLIWAHLDTGFGGATQTLPANGARPGGAYTLTGQDIFATVLRFQKNILP